MSKPRRKYPKNFAEKRRVYVCPEKERVEKMEAEKKRDDVEKAELKRKLTKEMAKKIFKDPYY